MNQVSQPIRLEGRLKEHQARHAFSVTVEAMDPRVVRAVGDRIADFLEGDANICTALEAIRHDGASLAAFLVAEGVSDTPEHARKAIAGGSVRVKGAGGQWLVVGNPEAMLRPGWWKVRKTLLKVGEDFAVEKRLAGGRRFSAVPGRRLTDA